MCFNVSVAKGADQIQARFHASFDAPGFEPIYHAAAFSDPKIPVVRDEKITLMSWGLVPRWARSQDEAKKLKRQTINARAESIFDRPAFRASIQDRRCFVIADGFFEWRDVSGKKYPYHVRMRDGGLFAMAGIWDAWKDPETSAVREGFSIITTRANPLLEIVHNTKRRMPAILAQDDERRWLGPLERPDIEATLRPYDDSKMEAFPVSRLITGRGKDSNVPAVLDKFDYWELKAEQARLM
jgi:putative SOS response-associated peptidase YedK